jgi:spermidine synthase
MYHVAGTAITVTLLYLISFYFYRAGLFSQVLHRKIWNSVLAATFVFTAFAGIFMALQINFKWDIPFIESLLKWHVETGVALVMTGIFHFLWHWSYFRNIGKSTETKQPPIDYPRIDPFTLSANLFMIGFTSTSVQVLLIREIMNITGGYELISGVFLGSWLIASAAGAAIASKSVLNNIPRINLIFAISPFVTITLLLLLTKLFLGTGEVPSFLEGQILTLILLVPFCLISGFAFVKLIITAKQTDTFSPGISFSIETTGGIISGVLLSVLTAGFFNTYELLLIIVLLFLAYTILTFYTQKKKVKILVKFFFAILISAVVLSEPDLYFRQLLLPALSVSETKDTPYGNITKGEYAGEKSIYYNQRLLSYTDDAMEREEDIHYAMLQVEKPGSVLLISGSPGSHFMEIFKYDIKKLVYVERDPEIVSSVRTNLSKEGTQVIIENKDAFRYVRNSAETFDAIIMLLPPPSTLSVNRFYTTDFFESAKQRLSPSGVFMCTPGQNDNYLNQESVNLFSSVYNSLKTIFRYVVPVAGNKVYFIASDKEVSVSFCRLADEKKIENIYVNRSFLADDLIERRSAEIQALMDDGIRQNRAAFPIACFHFQSYYISRSLNERIPATLLMIMAFVVPFFAVRRNNMLMYFSASALAGFEIIILLALQLTVGNMYQLTGLVIAAMMAGLAAGAGIRIKFMETTDLRIKAVALLIYYVVLALCFNLILGFRGVFAPVLLILLSVIFPSWLTGHIFRELTTGNKEVTGPGTTYSADLTGSALGFILISGVAVPALGIRNSIILLAVLIFAGILFGTKGNK